MHAGSTNAKSISTISNNTIYSQAILRNSTPISVNYSERDRPRTADKASRSLTLRKIANDTAQKKKKIDSDLTNISIIPKDFELLLYF